MSEELVEVYLTKCLVSFVFSKTEFQKRVKEHMPELEVQTIDELYRNYEDNDMQLLQSINDIIHKKYASVTSKMEQEEIEASISLAETNEILRKIDSMLKKREDFIKGRLRLENEKLSEYLDEISESTPLNESLVNRARELIDALKKMST